MKTLSKIALALGLCVAAAPLLAEKAAAQEGPVASAGSAAATDAQIRDYLDAAAAPLPAGSDDTAPTPVPDKAPHGEVEVGIGSNGYRHVHASTVVPVGEIGTAAIAVSDTRYNGRFGPRQQQSLSVAIALGDTAAQARSEACREDRLSGNGPEPMWVTRMRAAGQPSAAFACTPGAGR